MAGGKETPRQKMIGMMYLVLLALLAMNVSREIINAFVTLNNKIESQNETFEVSNSISKLELENAFVKTISEAGYGSMDFKEAYNQALVDNKASILKLYRLMAVADSVKMLAKEAVEDLMTTASNMLQEGQSGNWVERDEHDHLRIVNLSDPENPYDKKDDFDTPTRLMVDLKGAESLIDRVNKYRNSLISQIAAVPVNGKSLVFKPPNVIKSTEDDEKYLGRIKKSFPDSISDKHKKAILDVYRILTFPEKAESNGNLVPWALAKFDHTPMAAAAALLTSIKGQILQAEGVALNFINSENNVPPFRFDRIEPKAFAPTAYLNVGDSVEMEVMIAAYYSKAKNDIRMVIDPEDSVVDPSEMTLLSGTNKLILGKDRGGAVGDHHVVGQIAVEENGSTVWKDFDFKYKVGAPVSSIGNTEMNVMYIGYPNSISATGSGYTDVVATCSGCSSWQKSGDNYTARVSSGTRSVKVSVSGKDKSGNTMIMGTKEFRVLPMPRPRIIVPGVDPYKNEISALTLSNAFFTAKFTESSLSIPVGFERGSITIQYQGVSRTWELEGNSIPQDVRKIIKQLERGSIVVINAKSRISGNVIDLDPKVFRIL